MKSVTCFVVVLCCFIFNSVEGTIRHVPSQYQTVQAGIDASLNGDTVLVAEGRYYENIHFMGKAIIVSSDFFLDGDTSHSSHTIIDGSTPVDPYWASVVYFDSGEDTTSVLCGFTITGGRGTVMGYRAGGGILCTAGGRIKNNIIIGNTLDSTALAGGGGIFCSGGYCIIDSNRIESNIIRADGLIVGGGISFHLSDGGRILHNVISWNRSSSRGGGIAGGGIHVVANAGDTTRVTIADNRIEGNILEVAQPADACTGGGIWAATLPTITTNRSLILQVIGNDIIGNRLTNSMRSSGGGIIIQACSELSVLDKNRIIANTCTGALTNGAGLYVINSIPTITNNILAKNRLNGNSGGGGGLRLVNDVAVAGRTPVINNTISHNIAPEGAGIYTYNVDWFLMNSIVWYDSGWSDIYAEGGSFLVVFSNTEDGWNDTGSVCIAPGFVDTLYRLPDSSHCIGGGTNSIQIEGTWFNAPPRCVYGDPRPNPPGSRSDIGACENPLPIPIPVGLEETQMGLPIVFALEQNYPNPFNPTTQIRYGLPVQSRVIVTVYNIMGQEVTRLYDGTQAAGYHEVVWNAINFASGVYFYRLKAENFVSVKKLLLLK